MFCYVNMLLYVMLYVMLYVILRYICLLCFVIRALHVLFRVGPGHTQAQSRVGVRCRAAALCRLVFL